MFCLWSLGCLAYRRGFPPGPGGVDVDPGSGRGWRGLRR